VSQRFSALPDLALTDWDGETEAVYSPSAAKTHLLSAAAATVLRALSQCQQPADAPTLAQAIDSATADGPEGQQLPTVDAQLVQELLDGLYIAGLTRRHECP
jgi:hypothetical protein